MAHEPKRRVLVVEDHASGREAVRRILTQMGFEVATASTVSQGLEALTLSPPPDCILLDLTLPDGPGEQILERVRQEGFPCRVVICTGDNDPDRLNAAQQLGADAVLLKPVGLAELVAACRP